MSSRNRTKLAAAFSACLVAVVYATQALAGGGPVSKYYMTAGNRVIRGGTTGFIEGPTNAGIEYPMYVLGSMRTVGERSGDPGSGYDKNLNFNGKSYTNNVMTGNEGCFDATTDGCFMYTVNFDTGEVIRAKLGWRSPQVLFDAGSPGDHMGITYDPSNHSLWISRFLGGRMIENYDMQGNLLSSFDVGHDRIMCLALEHATGLLWVGDQDNLGLLRGYSRRGSLNAGIDYGFTYDTFGGEFDLGATSQIRSIRIRKGEFLSGVLSDMNRSDTRRYRIRSQSNRNGSSVMMCDIKFKSTVTTPDELDIVVESHLNTTGGTAKVFVKNWSTGRFDRVDTYAMSTTDSRETVYKVDATNYVDNRGKTVVRLRQTTRNSQNPGWKSFLNVVQVRVRE